MNQEEKKTETTMSEGKEPQKRRGRPPKQVSQGTTGNQKAAPRKTTTEKKAIESDTTTPVKRRGRPPKQQVEAPKSESMTTMASQKLENETKPIVPEVKKENIEEPMIRGELPKEPPMIRFPSPKEPKPSLFKTSEVVILIVVTAIICFIMGFLVGKPVTTVKNTDDILNDPIMQEFLENYKYIIDNYYDKVDKSELLNGAISGMVDALGDEHSTFIDPGSSDNFDITLKGDYEGLGIEIGNFQLEDNSYTNIYILKVFEGSDAEKKGLKVGDELISIDGKDMTGKLSSEASAYIRDSKKNSFQLVVKREEKEQTITIEKKKIDIQSVHSKVFEQKNKKIGYLGIDIFAANTDTQFKKVLKELEKQKIDSLIIDVRGNSGGHLTSVTNMLGEFLDSSHVIYQLEEKGQVSNRMSSGKTTKKYPIVVLMNQSSASASEVMAACLKEEYGATLVGKTTVGKGTVQTLISLSNDQEYKITTKKWLTPKGNWLNGKGLTPDYDVDLGEAYAKDPSDATDKQLQKAIELLTK